jgi:hypothetical protein
MNEPQLDRLGRELQVGDYVALPVGNHLRVGRVAKLTPKMVRVEQLVVKSQWSATWLKYADDLVVVEGPGVTMLVLKASK